MSTGNVRTELELALDPLLAATERCFATFGVRKTTLDDIAKEAGVSRSTLYRAYGSKTQIREALRAAKNQWMVDKLERRIPHGTPVAEALVGVLEIGHDQTRADPVVEQMLTHEPESLLPAIYEPTGGPSPYLMMADLLGRLLRERCPDVDRLHVTPEQAIEVLARVSVTWTLGPTTYLGASDRDIATVLLRGLGGLDG